MTRTTTAIIRWISGRRSDDDDPGGTVVATVFAPRQRPTGEYGTHVRCLFLHSTYMPVYGVDEAQCIELAIKLVFNLFDYRGVGDAVVSLVPPDDLTC